MYSVICWFHGICFQNIKNTIPEPYIDEIFHLRQCQTYCDYKFTQWDDKITTPPGLYIIGFVYSKLIELVSGYPACMDSNILRSVNLIEGWWYCRWFFNYSRNQTLVNFGVLILCHSH